MLTKIPNFRRCVIQNFPFIEEDFDALTDYELLSKVVEYLNKVIDSQNELTDDFSELNEAFNELNDYVEHYFDNLNVQEEINRKLDNMSADGSLTALIKNYIDPIQQSFETSVNNTLNTQFTTQNQRITNVENLVASAVEGTPIPVASTEDMTDTDRIYVNTTNGYWYYHNGEEWTQGGQYQSTGIALASIIGGMIKDKTITKDKLTNTISVLSLATDIYPHKAINHFYTNVGVVTTDNNSTNVAIFNLSAFNGKIPYYKIDNTTLDGGGNMYTVRYKSDDYTKFAAATLANIVNDPPAYDSTLGCGAIRQDGVYDKVAVTLNANYDIFIREPYAKPQLISGDSIKIGATDLLNYGVVTEGKKATGYDINASYLPIEVWDQGYNKITIELTEDNVKRLSQSYLYFPDPESSFTTRIIMYTENTKASMASLGQMVSSDYYDANTQTINLGLYLQTRLANNYDYISIWYESNLEQMFLYSTYLSPSDPNYDVFHQGDEYSLLMPPKIKTVENQLSNVYFQNAIRYQNSDLISYKAITNADFNNTRVAILDTSQTGSNTEYLRCAKDYQSAYNSESFNYQVVSLSAGNGQTKKVLMIGDSLTEAGRYTERLLNLFSNDVMNIQLLGSMQKDNNALNRYEGRAGWSTTDYTTNSTRGGHTNPFYNTSTSSFDFSYYMSEQGYTGVDYVFINLGTNDISYNSTTIVNNLNTMINSIKTYDSDIKIGLWLPPIRGITDDPCTEALTDFFNAMKINKLFIDTYKESSDVSLIPVYLNVNPYNDFKYTEKDLGIDYPYNVEVYATANKDKVHPNLDGYYHIGDVLFSWIKYFASL